MRHFWLGVLRGLYWHGLRLFRLREDSMRVARGFAVGIVVNFFPTLGFGPLISGFLARLFGGNLLAGLAGGASLVPFFPFIFAFNVFVGGWLVSEPPPHEWGETTQAEINALLWGKAFVVGAFVNGILVGVASYVAVRVVFQKFRLDGLRILRTRVGRDLLKSRRIRRPA